MPPGRVLGLSLRHFVLDSLNLVYGKMCNDLIGQWSESNASYHMTSSWCHLGVWGKNMVKKDQDHAPDSQLTSGQDVQMDNPNADSHSRLWGGQQTKWCECQAQWLWLHLVGCPLTQSPAWSPVLLLFVYLLFIGHSVTCLKYIFCICGDFICIKVWAQNRHMESPQIQNMYFGFAMQSYTYSHRYMRRTCFCLTYL